MSETKVKTQKLLSIKIDMLKVLLRLAKDCKSIRDKDYIALQLTLQEIGKMLGGWIRASELKDKKLSQEPTPNSD